MRATSKREPTYQDHAVGKTRMRGFINAVMLLLIMATGAVAQSKALAQEPPSTIPAVSEPTPSSQNAATAATPPTGAGTTMMTSDPARAAPGDNVRDEGQEPAAAEAAPVLAPPQTQPLTGSANDVRSNRPMETSLPPAAPPAHDLSPIGMFHAADIVVKSVMLVLIGASIVTWAVLLLKIATLVGAKLRMRRAERRIREASSLIDARSKVLKGVAARLLFEACEEAERSRGLSAEGIKERVGIRLSRIELAATRRTAAGLSLLATVGSVGPFVGLFGTVWGIMRSFIGIANSNTTNLAVVAPGIAEALLATGIGLVAAIPAVVIYNALTRSVSAYRVMTGDVAAMILCHLSRDLDRDEVKLATSPAMRHAAE